MDMIRSHCLAVTLSATVWLTGCTADNTYLAPTGMPATDVAPSGFSAISVSTSSADDPYAKLYPFYAEFCAVSEINKKPGFGADINGGFGGHSVLYLNGVCRDKDAGYPTIGLCTGKGAAQTGVGLSVNDHFKNANWVATEGRDFLFYGSLKPGEGVTRTAYERTQIQAKKMGILDGVEFHQHFFKQILPGMSRRDYMYELSIATDYAINFGRDRYCARVPMSRTQMHKVVTYLNALNAPYRDGKQEFQWDVLRNNCSHMTHNALAAAGIWTPIGVDQSIFVSAFDFPVPKNEFVNLLRRTNDMKLDDPLAVYGDDVARQSLDTLGRLPLTPGALAEAAPVVPENDLYETRSRLIFYDPMGRYQRRFEAIMADPRYLDLRTNLTHFAEVYRQAKAARRPLDWYLDPQRKIPSPGPAQFPDFYAGFYRYIDDESAAIDHALAALDRLQGRERQVMVSSMTDKPPTVDTP